MRLRAINTRGCVLQTAFLGLSNRLRAAAPRRRCAPIRSHRRDITRAARSSESRLVYVCITRAMHSQVYRGKATRTARRRRRWERRTCRVRVHRLLLSSFIFLFFCFFLVGMKAPLAHPFVPLVPVVRVRSLILACTPRASQGHSREGGTKRTDKRAKRRKMERVST